MSKDEARTNFTSMVENLPSLPKKAKRTMNQSQQDSYKNNTKNKRMKRKASIPTSALPSTSPLLNSKLVPVTGPSTALTDAGGSIMAEDSTTVGKTHKS